MTESRLHLNTGISLYNNPYAKPLMLPLPKIGGVGPMALYMYGNLYCQRSRIFGATGHGPGLDWTNNGHNMSVLDYGELMPNFLDYGVNCLTQSTGVMKLPASLTVNSLIASSGAYSIVALVKTVATARPVAIARDGTVAPFSSLTLAPQTADARAIYTDAAAVATTAQIGTLTNEMGNIALYTATFKGTQRQMFSKYLNDTTKVATETTPFTIAGTNRFEIGDEASTGSGLTTIYSLGFYPFELTLADHEAALVAQRTFHSTFNHGLSPF